MLACETRCLAFHKEPIMKYAILIVSISLILGGCAAPQNSISAYNNAQEANSGVSAFPVNLHGGQPYMARPASLQMQQCAVTATHFEAPSTDPTAPMKMIAASCWL
jgi:hypothetical protein